MILRFLFKAIRSLEYRWLHKTLLSSFKAYGNNFRFNPKSKFIDPQEMVFGNDVFINTGAHFSGQISVGNDVMFGPNVSIFAHDHYFAVLGKKLVDIESIWRHKQVKIGNHCWIGANTTLLSGVSLGDGCVVAAGSVLKGEYPPFTLIAGNPGKVLKKVFTDEALHAHLLSLGYSESHTNTIIEVRNKLIPSDDIMHIEQTLPSTEYIDKGNT